ncbi:MAG: RnfABCDGE type electron transport complex subunit D [Candidatus Omnitrophota bacterium]
MQVTVSTSPHLKSNIKTAIIMRQVMIALIPVVIAAVVFFKYRAIWLMLNCVLSAVISEKIILRIRAKSTSTKDGSAALSGLLLALILPPSIEWYAATLGSVFAIVVAKQLFGGLGSNIFNPALIGRAFLMAAYPKMLTTFVEPFAVDTVSGATPLALQKFSHITTSSVKLFWGNVPGSLGETCAIAIIIGGVYLLIKKIADWRIPLSLLVTTTCITIVFHWYKPQSGSILFHFLSGGLLLGAFFMATDPVTTPVTKSGRYIFGVGCGILMMIIRYFSGLPEGMMYSILFMNSLTPLINRYTRPKRFGT